MQFKSFAGFLVLSAILLGSGRATRTDGCGESCFWINKLIARKQLPLRGDIASLHSGHIFCFNGWPPLTLEGVRKIWTDVRVSICTPQRDGLIITRGNSSKSTLSADETTRVGHNGTTTLHLSPYGVSCVGLIPSQLSELRTVEYTLDAVVGPTYHRMLLFATGIGLLLVAPRLSRSVTLFYGAGVTLGIVGSILLLLYIFSKFVPKKSLLGLGVLAGGYTLFASYFYWFWTEAMDTALLNWHYITAYIVVAGLISFAVLYRMSPPTDVRSLNLIQWGMQLVGLTCVYFSCPLHQVGAAFVVGSVLVYAVPLRFNPLLLPFHLLFWLLSVLLSPFACCLSCLSLLNPLYWFSHKLKHRFLTREEYEKQGQEETKKALEELRKHCRHHDNSDIWEKISDLQDSKRFASFLSGKSHVSTQEMVDHEWTQEEEEEEEDIPWEDCSTTPNTSHNRSSVNSSSGSVYNSSTDSPTFTHSHPTHFTSTPHSHRTHFTSTSQSSNSCRNTPRKLPHPPPHSSCPSSHSSSRSPSRSSHPSSYSSLRY